MLYKPVYIGEWLYWLKLLLNFVSGLVMLVLLIHIATQIGLTDALWGSMNRPGQCCWF